MAVRRQRGVSLMLSYLAAVSDAVGRAVTPSNLLSLEATDRLFAAYADQFSRCSAGGVDCHCVRVPNEQAPALFRALERMGHTAGAGLVAEFGRDHEGIGAVRMTSEELFGAAPALLRIDRDHVRAISLDASQGLLIDRLDRERQIELWMWGARWLEHWRLAERHPLGS